MTQTRPGHLLALAAAFAVLGFLLTGQVYGSLQLPAYAPVTLVFLTAAEVGIERVIRARLAGRGAPRSRPIHPMQVARAVVLAKASSVTGSVLLGGYAGVLAWALPRRDELSVADRMSAVSAASVVASLALVAAALLLERACRVPDDERR